MLSLWSVKQSTGVRLCLTNKTEIHKSLVLLFPRQTQEGRAGEAHVSLAREQTGVDGAAGGSHEAAKGKTFTCLEKIYLQVGKYNNPEQNIDINCPKSAVILLYFAGFINDILP